MPRRLRGQHPRKSAAGLYWYHTHLHGESEAQTMLGLSGALVIENEDDDQRRQAGFTDRLLIVRDIPAPERMPTASGEPEAVESHRPEHASVAPAPRSTSGPCP